MNKLELELDEKKVLADGEYNLDELYGYIDYIAVTEKGLRKEGSFYIEDDPVDDGFGMIAAVELILLRNDWFRKYVKTLNCYWWDEETNSFDVEDGIDFIRAPIPSPPASGKMRFRCTSWNSSWMSRESSTTGLSGSMM